MRDAVRYAEDFNTIARFLARRDLPSLHPKELEKAYGVQQADLLILFGGSIPYGCDLAGQAWVSGMAKQLMIVGGEGHTTDHLRRTISERYPAIPVNNRMEADIIYDFLHQAYGITDCLMERNSTNCGNNVSYALEVVQAHQAAAETIIIMQDSSMQQRMDATFRKLWPPGSTIINFAAYLGEVVVRDGQLALEPSELWGMWDLDRYITLLLGEIPRLNDNEQGYGPNGKNFIAHVDIPPEVMEAFIRLEATHGHYIRQAF